MENGNDDFGSGWGYFDPQDVERNRRLLGEAHVASFSRAVVRSVRGRTTDPLLNTTDLVQDALLAMERKLRDGKGPKDGKPWRLWVRDTVRDVVREAKRRKAVPFGSLEFEPADTTTTVVGRCVRREQEEIVRDALARLDPESARIIDLCYRDGLSVAAIAESLGRSAPYVRNRRERALERLGESLVPSGLQPNQPDV